MARHVFVLLFVAVCLLQVVMTLAREDWDTDESPEARGKVLEGLKDAASKLSHKVVLSLPRERRDAGETSEAPTNILEGIERFANDLSKKTQEFFTADSFRALQANVTELANKVGAAISSAVDSGASTPAPAA